MRQPICLVKAPVNPQLAAVISTDSGASPTAPHGPKRCFSNGTTLGLLCPASKPTKPQSYNKGTDPSSPLFQSFSRTRNTPKSEPPTMKLLYPTTLRLDPALISGFPTLTLHAYDAKAPTLPADLLDAEILVTWANSPANLSFAAKNLPQLRWIQSLAAGPNDVLAAGFDTSRV